MQYHELKRKTKRAKHVQVGRGGRRGKTSGKGHKGQKARAGHKIRPEIRDMIKSIPKLRGRGVNINKPLSASAKTVSLGNIDKTFKSGEVVSPKTLLDNKLIRKTKGKLPTVKIVATGEINKKLVIKNCLFSEKARELAIAAGCEIK